MLFVALIPSLILLVLANLSMRGSATAGGLFKVGAPLAALSSAVVLFAFIPPLLLTSVGLLLTWLAWRGFGWRPATFLPASVLVCLLAWAYPTYSAIRIQEEYARLRAEFPLESLADRLPVRESPKADVVLSASAEKSLSSVEYAVPNHFMTQFQMGQLHETTRRLFINSPGFGVLRISFNPSEARLKEYRRPPTCVDQPDVSQRASELAVGGTHLSPEKPLAELHQDSTVDFVATSGLAYVKDRDHVAGFEPHQFSAVPKVEEPYRLLRLELVGLVVHDEPVVYDSGQLPRMDKVREIATRELDPFEQEGLRTLQLGDDLHLRASGNTIRMLGAIRAGAQCTNCHGVKRGELLGAFSYVLTTEGR